MFSCLFPTHSTQSSHLGLTWFTTIYFSTTHSHHHTKIADVIISILIINLFKFVVLSSLLRCLVPVRFSIIVTTLPHKLVTITIKDYRPPFNTAFKAALLALVVQRALPRRPGGVVLYAAACIPRPPPGGGWWWLRVRAHSHSHATA